MLLHAFARGQWAQVITGRGFASALAAAAAPTQLPRIPSVPACTVTPRTVQPGVTIAPGRIADHDAGHVFDHLARYT